MFNKIYWNNQFLNIGSISNINKHRLSTTTHKQMRVVHMQSESVFLQLGK